VSEQLQIAIGGGGIRGLTAALALAARGLNDTVFEQAGEQREIGAGTSIFRRRASAAADRPHRSDQDDRSAKHKPRVADIAWPAH
jgi:2-polyprenyl-6-methoxyphenol hydroxylase-like FAD-dependent oxidoreductase